MTDFIAPSGFTLRRLHDVSDEQIAGLSELLIECVAGGASVSFMHPLSFERARDFWMRVARDVIAGSRALLIAEDELGICGTVQLVLSQPENQPHRADLSKMLVHSRTRRRGLGEALMRGAERAAVDCGKSLLVLDTITGSDADRLYERLGWTRVGEIPFYALMPHGGLRGTTVFYRELAPHQS